MSVEEAQAQLVAAMVEWHAAQLARDDLQRALGEANEVVIDRSGDLNAAYRALELATAPQLDLSAS